MDYVEKIKQIEQETPKPNVNWLIAWQELAQMTLGLTEEDPRFESVMRREHHANRQGAQAVEAGDAAACQPARTSVDRRELNR